MASVERILETIIEDQALLYASLRAAEQRLSGGILPTGEEFTKWQEDWLEGFKKKVADEDDSS